MRITLPKPGPGARVGLGPSFGPVGYAPRPITLATVPEAPADDDIAEAVQPLQPTQPIRSTVPVLVDDRVGSKELVPIFNKAGIATKLCRLDSADFAFEGQGPLSGPWSGGEAEHGPFMLGFERKTVPDYIESLQKGRVIEQLARMQKAYARCYVIIEGPTRNNHQTGMVEYSVYTPSTWTTGRITGGRQGSMPIAAFWNSLATLEEAGVRVRTTYDQRATVDLVVALRAWWQKPYEEHDTHKMVYMPDMKMEEGNNMARVGRALGLGHAAAYRLGQKWKSLDELAAATIDDWCPDICRTRVNAMKIYKRVHGL